MRRKGEGDEPAAPGAGDAGTIAGFVRARRKALGYTQAQLAQRAGTGLRFVREVERGKATLRMDKVNQLLTFFGARLGTVPVDRDEG